MFVLNLSTKVLHANLQESPSLLHPHWDVLPIAQINLA